MDVTDIIGRFGRFQVKLLAVLCLRAVSAAFVVVMFQLISFDVLFECDNALLYNDLPSNYSTPCQPEVQQFTNETIKVEVCVNCQSFEYFNCSSHETVVQEWDLVCDREWYVSFGYLALTLGNFLSYIPAGQMADKYGRRPLSIAGQAFVILTTLACSLSSSVEMYMVNRVLTGIAFGLTQNPFLCLFLESVGPEYRDFLVFSFAGAWGIGLMTLAGASYAIPQWRTLYHVANLFLHSPLLLVLWFVPESVRWLLTVGHNDRAEKLMVKQAAENGIRVINSKSVMDLVKKKMVMDDGSKGPTMVELCKNLHLRKTSFIIYASFALTVFTYHGFIMTVGHLGGSLHTNVFFTGLVELPVVAGYFLIVRCFDRRRGLLFCLFFSGVLFLLSLPIPNELTWLRLSAAMVGRLLNALAYAILYVFAAELFPTNLRAVALSGAMTAGRVGGMISPLTDILARMYGRSVPIALYGILSIVTSFVLLLLPETRNRTLPDTVEDSEKLAEHFVNTSDMSIVEELLPTPLKDL